MSIFALSFFVLRFSVITLYRHVLVVDTDWFSSRSHVVSPNYELPASSLELVSLLLAAHTGRSVRLIAVEMAFEETPAIPRYRRTKKCHFVPPLVVIFP
jgi:hypothetical protein